MLPYWRWWRVVRERLLRGGKGAVAKPWNGIIGALALIVLLVGFDQWSKAQLETASWAWHNQPSDWLTQPAIGIALAIPFLVIAQTRLAAIFWTSGALGNLVSELRYDTIANPLQVQNGDTTIAFNMADVWLVTGGVLAAFTVLSLVWTLITLSRRRSCTTQETKTTSTSAVGEDSLASQSA